jgi:hypothetical protein
MRQLRNICRRAVLETTIAKSYRTTAMRRATIAMLMLLLAAPAAAQQRRPAATAGFDFNVCYSQCLSRGGSPGSCQPGCADRAAEIARIPAGAPRTGNNNPNSPNYYNPAPRQGFN